MYNEPGCPHWFTLYETKCPICGKPMAAMVWDADYWYRCTNIKCGIQTPVRQNPIEAYALLLKLVTEGNE